MGESLNSNLTQPKISDLKRILKSNWQAPVKTIRTPLPHSIQKLATCGLQFPDTDIQSIASEKIHTTSLVEKHLEPYMNLDAFKHRYWTEGTSSAIASYVCENQQIYFQSYDYTWLHKIPSCKPVLNIDEIPLGSAFYISQPFSGLGRLIDLTELENRRDLKVFLDLTYWGTFDPSSIEFPSNTQWVSISFSKNLGLWPFRVALLFTAEKVESLEAYSEANYVPYIGIQAVRKVLSQYSLYSVQAMLRPLQLAICSEYGILPAQSVLVGQESDWTYRRSLSFELAQALKVLEASKV